MNARDSEALACLLEMNGYLESEDESTADILIFNTCSVRDQAERKVIGKVGLMKRLKRDRPDLVIGIIGCMAQRLGGVLLEKLPHLDYGKGRKLNDTQRSNDSAELCKYSAQGLL